MNSFHKSVLLEETVNLLDIKPGKIYIDATLGGGGHTLEILKRGGRVIGIDLDDEALDFVGEIIKKTSFEVGKDIFLEKGNFREIKQIAHSKQITGISGILFDLGISSHQIDEASRGFSLLREGKLDMRMDRSQNISAFELVNNLKGSELEDIFRVLGEERKARQISEAIVRERSLSPIQTTTQLVEVIARANRLKPNLLTPKQKSNIAKRVFQALRIAVNDELRSLVSALPDALELLESKGRVAVISFHSLEDRIVKNQFQSFEDEKKGRIITKKPVIPGNEEILVNRRSRSSKLRVFEKI